MYLDHPIDSTIAKITHVSHYKRDVDQQIRKQPVICTEATLAMTFGSPRILKTSLIGPT